MAEWRPIVGFEGLYEISSDAEIRSVERITIRKIRGKDVPMKVQSKIIVPANSNTGTKAKRYVLHGPQGYVCRSLDSLMQKSFPELPQYQESYSDVHDLPNELWHTVAGWPSIFLVSNMGRAKLLSHRRKSENPKGRRFVPCRLVKPHIVGANSHLYISLRFNGESYSSKLVDLVAIAFLPKPENESASVSFIDGNKYNVRADNLKWQ